MTTATEAVSRERSLKRPAGLGHKKPAAPTPSPSIEGPAPEQPVEEPPRAAGLAVIDELLRSRKKLLERIESGGDLLELARTMILTIVVSAALFGAAMGQFRGGLQIPFAALKLPLVILLAAALSTPALFALRSAVAGRSALQRDLALVLSSLALGSLVLAALAPIVLLASRWGASYHELILVVVSCSALAGAIGLSLFVRGMRGMSLGASVMVGGTLLLVIALVGAQMTWTFRPYLVRPRTEDVPFIRAVEGSFVEAVSLTLDSARGIYHRAEAPLELEGTREGP